MDDIFGVQVVQGVEHLLEQSPRDGLAQCPQLQHIPQIMGRVLEDQSGPQLLLFIFKVDSLFDGLVEFDDMRMLEFGEEGGFFLEDGVEDLLGIGVVSGGEFDGVVVTLIGYKFDSKWERFYFPKVPSPKV